MGMLGAVASAVAVMLAIGMALLWRLHTESMRRAEHAAERLGAQLEEQRSRVEGHRAALRRYEVAFASINGRGELGEQALAETAKALGLREGLHFSQQADVAGGGAARPDLVLRVGGDRQVPVDAKASLACWAEAVETDDADERAEALRVHVRNLRARAAELAGKGYQRWADGVYGTVMFVPSDAAVVAALDTDPELLRWMLDRRVFLCGPTGFAVLASAALFAASDRALTEDIEALRGHATAAHRAAGNAVDAVNLSSTHLQRFLSARRRELDALEGVRAAVGPLSEATASPTEVASIRREQPEQTAS